MAWQGFFSASSSELPRAVDLQLPGEQWLVGMKVLEQDSLLACPGGDVKQQQDFFFSVLSALSPAVTPAEVTGEVAQLKGHISGVGCVCPFPELLLPEQPSPAVPAQPKETPREGSTRQPRPPARQRDGPDDAAAKIRATKVLTCPSLATLPGRLSLSLPAPGVGGEASKSQMCSLG